MPRVEPRVSDNEIRDNTSLTGGGGVRFCYFYGALPRPAFERNLVTGNSSPEGGGVLCFEADSLEAKECVLAENVATVRGGGLVSDALSMVPSIFLDRCTIHGNRAPDDIATPTGGGVLAAAGAVTVQSTIVCSNAGGGLVCLPDAVQASIL